MITGCRACGSGRIEPVLSLGEQYLSDFRPDDSRPAKYPLDVVFCHDCLLVQLGETAPRELMYGDGYGFYSGVNEGIRKDLAATVHLALGYRPDAESLLDIACNDGTLLCQVPARIRRTGVDPVTKFKALAADCADEIVSDYFSPDLFPGRQFHIVTSSSVFYDLDDPGGFVRGVRQVLSPWGVWVVQQNYLLAMLRNTSIDNVCHEHVTYWSLASLQRLMRANRMRIVDVGRSPINGGSFRTVVMHEGNPASESVAVKNLLRLEGLHRLHQAETYRLFADKALAELGKLRRLLATITASGERCYIYAASTRGSTLWQAAGIGPDLCPAAVERNPAKVGLYFSPIGCRIISEETARRAAPEYMVVGPWWFKDQIVERERRYLADGGRLIFPLPRLTVIGKAGREVPVLIED